MYDYLIVGSGISGSTFAHLAKKGGNNVCVLEKKNNTGGCLYQEVKNGITVHKFGPHIFHTNDIKVWEYITSFSEFNGFINQPIANVDGELYSLPFNMNTFKQLWGVKTPKEAEKKIAEDIIECDNPTNLEEFALANVGKTIYEKFIKKYTEKQWGKPCKDLPADFIKRLPIRLTYNNNYFNSKYQGIPLRGYNDIISKQLSGCDVFLGETNFKDFEAKNIIYTGPLDELFDYCYGELEWRSLSFETWTENTENYQGCAVMNFNGDEPYTRIIEHKHFLNEKSDKTILTKETPSDWQKGKERYYPVQSERNRMLYKKYYELAIRDGIYPLGRLGRYKYIDMDQAIKEAFDLYYMIECLNYI